MHNIFHFYTIPTTVTVIKLSYKKDRIDTFVSSICIMTCLYYLSKDFNSTLDKNTLIVEHWLQKQKKKKTKNKKKNKKILLKHGKIK